MRQFRVLWLALAAFAGFSSAPAFAQGETAKEREALGLFGTLPIYWNEAGGVAEILSATVPAHWARIALEERYELRPLDQLSEDGVADLEYLLLAQPRVLSPRENVVLDNWVKEGGRLLLFADPMLTEHSRFGIGDPRRPQDVVLLSPILSRWGLELHFDEAQPLEENTSELAPEVLIDTHLAGYFTKLPSDVEGDCELLTEGLVAECSLGSGRAIIVADAASLEGAGGQANAQKEQALEWLVDRAFRESRGLGNSRTESGLK